MASHHRSNTAGSADGVQFINKDETRCLLARLFKKLPYPCRTDANKHFDKLGTGDGEKGYLGLFGTRHIVEGDVQTQLCVNINPVADDIENSLASLAHAAGNPCPYQKK